VVRAYAIVSYERQWHAVSGKHSAHSLDAPGHSNETKNSPSSPKRAGSCCGWYCCFLPDALRVADSTAIHAFLRKSGYEQGRELGRGHFGRVFEAKALPSCKSGVKVDTVVAIKHTTKRVGANEAQKYSSMNSFKIVCRMRHHLSGMEDFDDAFLVFDLCSGGTLAEYLEQQQKTAIIDLVPVAELLCKCVPFAISLCYFRPERVSVLSCAASSQPRKANCWCTVICHRGTCCCGGRAS
jgi:serine/threonine protein kinase